MGNCTNPSQESQTQDRLRILIFTKQDTGNNPASCIGQELRYDQQEWASKGGQLASHRSTGFESKHCGEIRLRSMGWLLGIQWKGHWITIHWIASFLLEYQWANPLNFHNQSKNNCSEQDLNPRPWSSAWVAWLASPKPSWCKEKQKDCGTRHPRPATLPEPQPRRGREENISHPKRLHWSSRRLYARHVRTYHPTLYCSYPPYHSRNYQQR